ncbi:DUF2520 domain-containing protein [Clostridiaceae bacterium M8S5]|nr:DUF2520 domain-containing protein [Clostridiaceae bacterium M8S5]
MIGFIGAGKVGTSIGQYLNNNGVKINGYYSRTEASAKKAAFLSNSTYYSQLNQLINDSRYIMITTPDDVISTIASQLLSINTCWKNKLVCHTSGAHPSTLLHSLSSLGATIASLHPMLSFANIQKAVELLEHTPLTLEGSGDLMYDFNNMLKSACLQTHEIKTEQKALYHCAACIVSNYLVTVLEIGTECLIKAGFDSESASNLIKPLINGTTNNYFTHGSKALTGPLARGDVNTIKTHLEAISKEDSLLENIYRLLGIRTLQVCKKQNNLDEYTLNNLKEVLHNEKNHY